MEACKSDDILDRVVGKRLAVCLADTVLYGSSTSTFRISSVLVMPKRLGFTGHGCTQLDSWGSPIPSIIGGFCHGNCLGRFSCRKVVS